MGLYGSKFIDIGKLLRLKTTNKLMNKKNEQVIISKYFTKSSKSKFDKMLDEASDL